MKINIDNIAMWVFLIIAGIFLYDKSFVQTTEFGKFSSSVSAFFYLLVVFLIIIIGKLNVIEKKLKIK